MAKILTLFSLLFCLNGLVSAQQVTKGNLNTWFLALARLKVGDHWSFTNELHERTGSFLSDQGQFLVRPSVDFHLNKNIEFTVGYTFVRTWPYSPYSLAIPRNEHNVWEQVLLKFSVGKVHFQNRFREENRFVGHVETQNGEAVIEGADYSNRFRYRFTVSFDLYKFGESGKGIFFNGFDEIFINQDKFLRPTSFTRNWIYLGTGLRLNPDTNLQIGYMSQFDAAGSGYISSPILQMTFFHQFKL